jgi:hypothetical protein
VGLVDFRTVVAALGEPYWSDGYVAPYHADAVAALQTLPPWRSDSSAPQGHSDPWTRLPETSGLITQAWVTIVGLAHALTLRARPDRTSGEGGS